MTDLKLEYWEPTKLVGYIRNPRKNDQVVQRMIASISEFGFTIPILAKSDGSVIDGHLRLKAAIEMKMETVPVVIADHMSESQIKAFRLLANRSANWAEWDEELLKIELIDLKASGFNLELTGFDAKEFDLLLKSDVSLIDDGIETTKEEVLNELIDKYQVREGQIWAIGQHRLAVGNCIDESLINRLLGHRIPQVLFTSPPYWIGLDYEQESNWKEIIEFIDSFAKVYSSKINPSGRIIINTGMTQGKRLESGKAHTKLLIDTWQQALSSFNWLLRYVRFWIKDGGIYHTNPDFDCIDNHCEFIGYFYQPSAKFRGVERLGESWCGKGYWSDIPGASKQSGHVAAFPLELVSRNLRLFTREGESVMEPFGGSGTTMLVCEQLKRICYGCELNVGYAALSIERLVKESGLDAKAL